MVEQVTGLARLVDKTSFVYSDNQLEVKINPELVCTLPGGVTKTVPRESILYVDTVMTVQP